jgi:hypothetical protein
MPSLSGMMALRKIPTIAAMARPDGHRKWHFVVPKNLVF